MALVLSLILTAPGTALAVPRVKVLFDCDLAGDVDDAYAVALLLTSPEFEVLGLVMDHGHIRKLELMSDQATASPHNPP